MAIHKPTKNLKAPLQAQLLLAGLLVVATPTYSQVESQIDLEDYNLSHIYAAVAGASGCTRNILGVPTCKDFAGWPAREDSNL